MIDANPAPRPAATNVQAAHALRRAHGSALAPDTVAIMGPLGSGESTLLHTLAGIERTDAGSVLFGEDHSAPPESTALNERERSKPRRESFLRFRFPAWDRPSG